MNHSGCYENYPFPTVILSLSATLALYASGLFVMLQAGLVWCLLYAAYFLALEIRLLRSSCRNCSYYGKSCAFGRGKICRLLFAEGNPQKFVEKNVTWANLLPDLLVSLIPILTGILIILLDFSWTLLAIILLMVILTTAGNGLIRGRLACKYCKQRETGCPAVEFFSAVKKTEG